MVLRKLEFNIIEIYNEHLDLYDIKTQIIY
jgi:hypothetical protein